MAYGGAVTFRDLPHKGQPEAPAAGSLSPAGRAIERLEHALALSIGNAVAMIAHRKFHGFACPAHLRVERRRAVALSILHEVAHHPREKPRIAVDRHGIAGDGD